MNTIGERIAYLREIQNIKQKELAAAIGITAATMSKYENNINIPSADILSKIADELKTSTDYLVGRTSYVNPYLAASFSKYSTERLFELILKLDSQNKLRIYERVLTLLELQSEGKETH